RINSREFSGRDAGDRDWNIVNQNGLRGRLLRICKMPLAESKADHRNRGRSRLVVIRIEHSSGGGHDAEASEILARNVDAFGRVRLFADRNIEIPSRMKSEHAREHRVHLSKYFERWEW